MLKKIHWLGHDAFRIDGPPIIYFDPYTLGEGNPAADIILISHEHGDHCSPEDVAKIQRQGTTIVTIAAAAAMLKGDILIVQPGDTLRLKGIEIEAVPAYNVNKFRSPGIPFHAEESGHVGFVVTLAGQRIYHTGDSDHIPEMADLGHIDIAFLPVSGHYVMTAGEAAEAAGVIRPTIAIPMHVGRGIGAITDTEAFRARSPVEVVVLDIE